MARLRLKSRLDKSAVGLKRVHLQRRVSVLRRACLCTHPELRRCLNVPFSSTAEDTGGGRARLTEGLREPGERCALGADKVSRVVDADTGAEPIEDACVEARSSPE